VLWKIKVAKANLGLFNCTGEQWTWGTIASACSVQLLDPLIPIRSHRDNNSRLDPDFLVLYHMTHCGKKMRRAWQGCIPGPEYIHASWFTCTHMRKTEDTSSSWWTTCFYVNIVEKSCQYARSSGKLGILMVRWQLISWFYFVLLKWTDKYARKIEACPQMVDGNTSERFILLF